MAEDEADQEGVAGSLLLAHPSLKDPSFKRTVILMSSHDEQGAMGLVLNRPTGKTLGELSVEHAVGPLAHVPVFRGGPVETDRLLLCAWKFNADGSGFQLMVGLEPERAVELQGESGMHFRCFLGYSGWSAGQLESEMRQNAWVQVPLLGHLLDIPPTESAWREILISQDDMWKLFAQEPDDLEAN